MAAMSISLSEKMRTLVKSRVESGDYYNESEYIRDLIRRDHERNEYNTQNKAIQAMYALQQASVERGIDTLSLEEVNEEIKSYRKDS
jgi:antitoxin ParD1/3/4